MMSQFNDKRWPIWLSGCMFGAALALSFSAIANKPAETLYKKMEVLAEAIVEVENHYVDHIEPDKLVYNSIRGLLSSLDEHSAFLPPEELQTLNELTDGEHGGVGIILNAEVQPPRVEMVRPQSPAELADIYPDFEVLEIDGVSTLDKSAQELTRMLRGPIGTRVQLLVRPDDRDEVWPYTMMRQWIRIPAIEVLEFQPGFFQVNIESFSYGVANDVHKALFNAKNLKGILFDLRDNPGGLFDEAVALSDLFLTKGSIVTAIGRDNRVLEKRIAHRFGTLTEPKIALLINPGTASAAEIFVGAITQNKRGASFGELTYGKGSVQNIIQLSDGSGMKLTISKYLTPDRRQIDGYGLAPTFPMIPEDEENPDAPDVVLQEALKWLTAPTTSSPNQP